MIQFLHMNSIFYFVNLNIILFKYIIHLFDQIFLCHRIHTVFQLRTRVEKIRSGHMVTYCILRDGYNLKS
jgi:hypothetical protein